MHKTRYNSLQLTLEITPNGPLLIKSGGVSGDPSLPDMQFVRTYLAEGTESLYIPGSSIKGVVRGFIEQALRTLNDRETWRWACATFERRDNGNKEPNCAELLDELENHQNPSVELATWDVYRYSCGACRVFGNTRMRGRLAFADLMPIHHIHTEVRYGVAISRMSHAVAQGPFEMEVAVDGTFRGILLLQNYEVWHIGLLATALEAMNYGLLKVGFGKNRGFGQVKAKVTKVRIEELSHGETDNVWRGLGEFVDDKDRTRYGLARPWSLDNLPASQQDEIVGFYRQRTYTAADWRLISHEAIQALT